jgi:UDP-glucose 4-epimerase
MTEVKVHEDRRRALVTGCAGFIGSHVTDLLLELGYQVFGLDNLSTGKTENLPEHDNFQFINGDIRDLSLFNLLGEVDYVFHLAALARIQPSIQDPVTSNYVNHIGTLNVLEYCRKHKAKLIFSGSSSIYAGIELPTKESDTKDPKSPYALQKLQGEQYIQLYGDLYGLDYAILRYFNVYGERQITEGAYSAIVGIFLQQKADGKPLTITNDGEQRRDFTYVKDVAKANVMARDWPKSVYNIGTGNNYSINELADEVGGEKKYIGDRQGEARATQADNSVAREQGWKPTKDIKDWIHDQIQG